VESEAVENVGKLIHEMWGKTSQKEKDKNRRYWISCF